MEMRNINVRLYFFPFFLFSHEIVVSDISDSNVECTC